MLLLAALLAPAWPVAARQVVGPVAVAAAAPATATATSTAIGSERGSNPAAAPDARAPGALAPPPPSANIPTLGEVRAVAPDEAPPVDLYRFRNPIQSAPNRFDNAWRPPPSPEQISQGGGYLLLGVYYALGAAAQGVHALTHGPEQIQPAIARPPPLSEAQLQRAAAMCGVGGAQCAGR